MLQCKWSAFFAATTASIMTALAGACVTPSQQTIHSDFDTNGKADSTNSCGQQYVEWLVTDVKPLFTAAQLDSRAIASINAIRSTMPCGEWSNYNLDSQNIAFDLWQVFFGQEVTAPYTVQWEKSFAAWALAASPTFHDHDSFVASTKPRADLAKRADLLQQFAPPDPDQLAHSQFYDEFSTTVETVTLALDSSTLGDYQEWLFSVNDGEKNALELVALGRPRGVRDGAFAAWITNVTDVLLKGTQGANDSGNFRNRNFDCPTSSLMCSPVEVIAIYDAIKPTPVADLDRAAWISSLSRVLILGSPADENFPALTALYDQIAAYRPLGHATGIASYSTWLAALEVIDAGSMQLYLKEKPCTTGAAAEKAFDTWKQVWNPAAATIALAAPQVCTL
jgi:hypothetical protein